MGGASVNRVYTSVVVLIMAGVAGFFISNLPVQMLGEQQFSSHWEEGDQDSKYYWDGLRCRFRSTDSMVPDANCKDAALCVPVPDGFSFKASFLAMTPKNGLLFEFFSVTIIKGKLSSIAARFIANNSMYRSSSTVQFFSFPENASYPSKSDPTNDFIATQGIRMTSQSRFVPEGLPKEAIDPLQSGGINFEVQISKKGQLRYRFTRSDIDPRYYPGIWRDEKYDPSATAWFRHVINIVSARKSVCEIN